ncbi:ThuA domain-containing protein [Chitinophaga agrisoli]|uniref:ThuA domain-containing protein n=1 Tax=Chitinophaga agrisoli TaxID=2607653 RepID=A0A5B2VWH7_9BACT|nr:ThuA domain-containing protein [Chitinophaga agrisoli]KAA2243000.1 ThuA domain-containing protein [Chitinophaga agrisoli]
MRARFWLLLIVLFSWASLTNAQSPAQHRIRVLIIDGFSNHDWKQTTRLIKGILEESRRFSVAVTTAPPTPHDTGWDNWRPTFTGYDVIIQNTNNINDTSWRWPRRVERQLEEYVRAGGGLYILHSANNAFAHWQEYNRMIGLGWRNRQTGVALELDSNGHIIRTPPGQGEQTNHGDRFDAVIHILQRHPINQGYPEHWKTASMELYRYPRGPAEHLTVLSAAYDSISKKTWPVEWVVKYGKGRVYNSSMGHLWKGDVYPISYRCIGFETTVIRVTEWLATGKVTYPVPANFPTATEVSLRAVTDEPKGASK